jgi:hypothetical protein
MVLRLSEPFYDLGLVEQRLSVFREADVLVMIEKGVATLVLTGSARTNQDTWNALEECQTYTGREAS